MVKGYAKTEQVQTTLTPKWRDRLDDVAEWREQSRADGIRDAIEAWVVDNESRKVETPSSRSR